MIDVPRFRHAHHRMKQQGAVDLVDRLPGQFLVRAMQGIARLKGDHIPSPEGLEPGPDFDRCQTQILEIIKARQGQDLKTARNVHFAPTLHLCDQRVLQILGPKDLLRHLDLVPVVDLFNRHDCE